MKFLLLSFQVFHSCYLLNVVKLENNSASTNSFIKRINKLILISRMPKVQQHPPG